MKNKPTPEDIFKLAEKDPVIRAALTMHLREEITFPESIMIMVITLHNQNRELRLLAENLAINAAPLSDNFGPSPVESAFRLMTIDASDYLRSPGIEIEKHKQPSKRPAPTSNEEIQE